MRGELTEMWQFVNQEIEESPWVINRLLRPRGKILMAGEPKVGKSVLALAMAVALQEGSPVWGLPEFTCEPCSVLYMQTEVGPHSLQERLRCILRGRQPGEGEVWLYNMPVMYVDQDDEARREMHEVIDRCSPDVLILDPLSDLIEGDDNRANEAKRLTSFLQAVVEEHQLALVLVHHTGKPGVDTPTVARGQHAARGSSEFTRWSNTNIIVTNAGDDGEWRRLRLHFNVRDSAPLDDMYVEYNKVDGGEESLTLRVCDTTPAEAKLRKVANALRDGNLSLKNLVNKLVKGGMSVNVAYAAVRQARTLGIVEETDKMLVLTGEKLGKEDKELG